MKLLSPIKLNIAKKLKEDKAYRKRFLQRRTQDEIAMSIRSLREKRQMRQVDIAASSGMKQSAISRIEQADYASWTLKVLFRVADALNARVRVIFEPIEDVIEKYDEKEKEITSETEQYSTPHLSRALIEYAPVNPLIPSPPIPYSMDRDLPTIQA
jgi:transcriptional regulator with XRE-family HTH domain